MIDRMDIVCEQCQNWGRCVQVNPVTGELFVDKRSTCSHAAPVRISCPHCGGQLSEPRLQNGKRWLHCFSCHFEYEMEERG